MPDLLHHLRALAAALFAVWAVTSLAVLIAYAVFSAWWGRRP